MLVQHGLTYLQICIFILKLFSKSERLWNGGCFYEVIKKKTTDIRETMGNSSYTMLLQRQILEMSPIPSNASQW